MSWRTRGQHILMFASMTNEYGHLSYIPFWTQMQLRGRPQLVVWLIDPFLLVGCGGHALGSQRLALGSWCAGLSLYMYRSPLPLTRTSGCDGDTVAIQKPVSLACWVTAGTCVNSASVVASAVWMWPAKTPLISERNCAGT